MTLLTRAHPALCFFLLTVAARLPFTSKLLYHMDSVHFALALERYDLTVHQPHPPGYFFYVMLGRLFNGVIHDANAALVAVSILFSALTVAVTYLVGREVHDHETGLVAGALALTSPNLWLHGEVALSYGAEAMFSAVVGLLCWKVYRGRHHCLFLAAIVLGLAGGFRQNSVIFLLPLLLCAGYKTPPRHLAISLALLAGTCLTWFLPMVWLTGGWHAYAAAFGELWEFCTGHHTVFEQGWPAFKLFGSSLYTFTIFSLGLGALPLLPALYRRLRKGPGRAASPPKVLFFAAWTLPACLFYLFVFIHPANPGYALIFTPPLLVLSARAITYLGEELSRRMLGRAVTGLLTLSVLLCNTCVFLGSAGAVSWRAIREHDRELANVIRELRSFDPSSTALCILPYLFFGFRQVMYYLPQYRVYQIDTTRSITGQSRVVFWGTDRHTWLSSEVQLPPAISSIATVLAGADLRLVRGKEGIAVRRILPELAVASGPAEAMAKVLPVRINIPSRPPTPQWQDATFRSAAGTKGNRQP